jgi:hypothetical protein
MRASRFLNLAILSALVATSAAVYAQDEKQQEDKTKQEEPKRQDEARPAAKQDEMNPPHQQDEAKPAKQDKNEQKQMEKQSKEDEKQGPEHGQARPAGNSARIPDDKFHSHFGRTHTFHPPHPQVVNGQTQFVYGGYSFVMVDVWPVGWAYSDDCYIDYVDGEYFLFDLLHPGVRISLTVVL